jgi:transcriptional regulator with XRE-family HTH domain
MSQLRPKLPSQEALRRAFGLVITSCRKQRSLSQELLAELTDLSTTYIGLLERGKRNLTVYACARIAAAFGLSTSELVRLAEEQLPERMRRQI